MPSKRQLNKQQLRRISKRQKDAYSKPNQSAEVDEASLGPEQKGQVISHFGAQVDIEAQDSKTGEKRDLYRCQLRNNLGNIAVGDHVIWREDRSSSDSHTGIIVALEPRRSELLRPDSFGKMKHVAANVDRVLIVIAPQPTPFHNLIDRYLVAAENNSLDIHIVINKSDLIQQSEVCQNIFDSYSKLGYQVHQCSSKTGHNMEAIKEITRTGCSIFVGQSGVGKSSIVSRFLPDENIKVGDLSSHEKKGKHTTTFARLFHFQHGGDCIDSPGIREFGLWHMSAEQVNYGFIEFRERSQQCRFRDCKHVNEPSCAILASVKNQQISQARYDSFQLIINSLDRVNIIDT